MKTIQQKMFVLGFAVGLSILQPFSLWAAEHGGVAMGVSKEHAGAAPMKSHEEMQMHQAKEAKLLREAAAALRKGEMRMDLAAKLEEWAKDEHAEK